MKEIHLVMRNSDMTEGRGPMVIDSVFFDKQKAIVYMDQQPGIMGIRRKWSQEDSGHWEIKSMRFQDSESFSDFENSLILKGIRGSIITIEQEREQIVNTPLEKTRKEDIAAALVA